MIPYVHSGIFLVTLNTTCRWSKLSAKKNILSISKVVTFEATPKFWGMEDWRKWCKESTCKTRSKSFPVGVYFISCCSLSIYLLASSSSCCFIIVESSPFIMIICSFSSRIFLIVSFEKLSSLCCNNAASIVSLSVAGLNPPLIDGLYIGMCHWPCRWLDGAQCKCKCWFVF